MAVIGLAVASGIAGAVAAAIYLFINNIHSVNDIHELTSAVTLIDGGTLPRRMALAVGGIIAVFGVVGVAAAGAVYTEIFLEARHDRGRLSFSEMLCLLTSTILIASSWSASSARPVPPLPSIDCNWCDF